MEIITLSGVVNGRCVKRQTKRGTEYLIFKVSCEKKKHDGKLEYTVYRCTCFNLEFETLKEGDIVFLTGNLQISVTTDDGGKTCVNRDVFIMTIDSGK
jgi:ketosteroid isomerase-like protein